MCGRSDILQCARTIVCSAAVEVHTSGPLGGSSTTHGDGGPDGGGDLGKVGSKRSREDGTEGTTRPSIRRLARLSVQLQQQIAGHLKTMHNNQRKVRRLYAEARDIETEHAHLMQLCAVLMNDSKLLRAALVQADPEKYGHLDLG